MDGFLPSTIKPRIFPSIPSIVMSPVITVSTMKSNNANLFWSQSFVVAPPFVKFVTFSVVAKVICDVYVIKASSELKVEEIFAVNIGVTTEDVVNVAFKSERKVMFDTKSALLFWIKSDNMSVVIFAAKFIVEFDGVSKSMLEANFDVRLGIKVGDICTLRSRRHGLHSMCRHIKSYRRGS